MSTAFRSPPLEAEVQPFYDGERMDTVEFMRRYEQMPDLHGVELIEGVVYMPSPILIEEHGEPQGDLLGWVFNYRIATPGTRSSAPGTVQLDWRNDPEPDGLLWIDEPFGGQGRINAKGYFGGAPECLFEVSASSKRRDVGPKLLAYQRNEVQEYIVWIVGEQRVQWYRLRNGRFEMLNPDAAGIYKSEVFPGLWLDEPALLRGDMLTVIAVLNQGLATAEHSEFVARLQATARPRSG